MKPRKLRNLLEFKDRNQVREMIGLASGRSNEAEINEILLGYITNTKWALHGFFEGHDLQALIGLELLPKKEAKLQYISVKPDLQKQGLGSELIEMTVKKHKIKVLKAETDSDGRGFYEKLDFTLADESNHPSGTPRFHFQKSY